MGHPVPGYTVKYCLGSDIPKAYVGATLGCNGHVEIYNHISLNEKKNCKLIKKLRTIIYQFKILNENWFDTL